MVDPTPMLKEIKFMDSRIKQLVLENERLKTALLWYADEDNYDDDHAPVEKFREFTNYDCGEVARKALGGD